MNADGVRTEEVSAYRDSIAIEDDSDKAKELTDAIVGQVWQDLGGQVPWAQIRKVATDVAATFLDAKVRTFVPIFIRRQTRERLREGLDDQAQVA
jgi:hypothetical protein